MIAAIANGAWLAASSPAWARFLRALQNPQATQQELLSATIARNASCAYGRAHHFESICDYGQFCERVPIVDYDALAPWVHRIMQGERGVLTTERVTRLVPTSGSSGGRKLIPYTASFQRQMNAAIGPWMLDLCREHPAIAGGPAYWSISPSLPESCDPSAVPIGFDDDSAYLGGVAQKLAEATFAVPPALRLVNDVETSRYLTLLFLIRERGLRLVSVWHPSFLALMLDALCASWDELLADVKNGGCRRAVALRPDVRACIPAKPMPARASELLGLAPSDIRGIWPHLKVVSCWGDAQSALPYAELGRRLPGIVLQNKGLLATEAVVSIPFRGRHPLAIRSHFVEFENSRGEVLLAHELVEGGQYGVIVTTGGGLWRYRLGDIVEVDGFVGRTPSIRFLGRGGSTSDLCGEKLTEVFVTRAIAAACEACSCTPSFALLAPECCAGGTWRYTLFCDGSFPESFAYVLDDELRKNPHYALCRDLGQLAPLQCCAVPSGAYWQAGMDAGQRLGDIKPRALSARTDLRAVLFPDAR